MKYYHVEFVVGEWRVVDWVGRVMCQCQNRANAERIANALQIVWLSSQALQRNIPPQQVERYCEG